MTKKLNWAGIYIFALFVLGLALVIWTVVKTSTVPVQLDNSFFETKREIDDKFNDMANANIAFNQRYNTNIIYNEQNITEIDFEELFLAQRVIEKKGTHKNYLKVGSNKIEFDIKDKNGNAIVDDVDIHAMVTIASNNTFDIELSNFELKDGKYISLFEIPKEANWNVNGIVTIGEDKGYFFIKTNAK
ncbi:MAG: hypothetical protein RBQ81_04955 [Arcobacteraceae bacterium]|jgi:hypothetical protein|nr:hypothetical protein [Arcobacteraceae bacterium]MDY0365190.1 hypothetical protein [Arcobacteraceae bacterium]